MMTINLICVGNLKETFSKQEQEEYLKRLSAFCKVNVIEIKEQNQFENSSVTLKILFSGCFQSINFKSNEDLPPSYKSSS